MNETSVEVQLDEEYTGLRTMDSYAVPLKSIYEEIEGDESLLKSGFPVVESMLKNFVFEKRVGLCFSHAGKSYFYRTSELDSGNRNIEGELDPNSRSPAEFVLNLGDCRTFFITLTKFANVLESNKHLSKWISNMTVSNVWERATLGDLDEPNTFLYRIMKEIELGGLLDMEWQNVGTVITRNGPEDVYVSDKPSMNSYIEGPRTLHIATTSGKDNPSFTDHLHSVNYGLDSDNHATIYSVQLDAARGLTKKRIESNAQSLNRHLTMLSNDFLEIPGLTFSLPGNIEEADLDELGVELDRINDWLNANGDPNKGITLGLIRQTNILLDKQYASLEVLPSINERDDKLKRFNMSKGGASMVSFITAMALLRQHGVKSVKVPIYLPFTQHAGVNSESIQQNLTDALISRVQVFRSLTEIPEVEEEGVSFVTLDISNWDIDIKKVNKATKQLVPLVTGIRAGINRRKF